MQPNDSDLHAFVDGLLSPADRARVERSLREDPRTAARVAGWQADAALLRQALASEANGPVPAVSGWRRPRPAAYLSRFSVAAATAMAATAMLGASLGWWARGSDVPHGLDGLSAQAVLNQRVLAGGAVPVVLQTGGRLPVGENGPDPARTVAAPDLQDVGYTLSGSRVVATEQGTAALFIYADRGGGRIGLFVRLMIGVDADAPLRPVSAQGMGGLAWAKDGVGYSLVSADGNADLRRLVAAIRVALAADP